LAVVLAASGLAAGGAEAQPFGRAMAFRVADRRGERREERRQERRAAPAPHYAPGYRGQPYPAQPPARAYAYPAPAQAYPYPQRGAPPAYTPPPPPPSPQGAPQQPYYRGQAPAPWRNSLGAYSGGQQEAARQGVRSGRAMPLGQLTAGIRRSVPGRMLDAYPETGPDGRPAYRIRWAAAGGRRIDFIVDAATGAIIGQSGY
jgi:hypothetical protein